MKAAIEAAEQRYKETVSASAVTPAALAEAILAPLIASVKQSNSPRGGESRGGSSGRRGEEGGAINCGCCWNCLEENRATTGGCKKDGSRQSERPWKGTFDFHNTPRTPFSLPSCFWRWKSAFNFECHAVIRPNSANFLRFFEHSLILLCIYNPHLALLCIYTSYCVIPFPILLDRFVLTATYVPKQSMNEPFLPNKQVISKQE